MRYFVRDEIEAGLPDYWDASVQAANQYVANQIAAARARAAAKAYNPQKTEAFVRKARAKAISKKGADTWGRLADLLSNKSHEKCWYCECVQARSDMAVDHFRPKNRVEECKDHPGYYWLAFEWRNYRYSCTYCNSYRKSRTSTPGGKQCRFPIIDESKRAKSESDDWEQESPDILDPYVRSDTRLITFLSNGQPSPISNDPQNPEYKKVITSIDVYHLDERGINKERREIGILIRKFVKRIDDDPSNFDDLKDEILRRIRPTAPYSTAARIYLRQYIGKKWVQELLEDL
jgi:uncharacterized protein (TIGR02646 family)